MNGDIKSNIQLLTYPKELAFDPTKEKIVELIENNKVWYNKYKTNLDYYIGKNRTITTKRNVDPYNPDSRISVPYSRSFAQIVKGYMYKPGLITYHSEDEAYLQKIDEIFRENNEPLVTSELGEGQVKYGVGVELLYTDRDKGDNATPYFISVNPEECVFVFDMSLRENLIGAIRKYIIKEDQKTNEKTYNVEVYTDTKVDVYIMTEKFNQTEITLSETFPTFFGAVPFVLYKNNQEYHADYEPIQPLIDAYDVLCSDSINELNRFASAYLILKDYIFSNSTDANEKRAELEKLKTRRVLEFMDGQGGAEFLTKDIPSEFFEIVKRTIREDIEYHSHIPDFRSKTFDAKSGVAQEWTLFDFENLCGDKQALFEVGLRRRLELINNFLKIKAVDSADVTIEFQRNKPRNINEKVEQFVKLASTSKIADEDLLNMLPEELLPDLEAAIERAKLQKEENIAMFDLDNQPEEDNEDED